MPALEQRGPEDGGPDDRQQLEGMDLCPTLVKKMSDGRWAGGLGPEDVRTPKEHKTQAAMLLGVGEEEDHWRRRRSQRTRPQRWGVQEAHPPQQVVPK